MGFESFEYLPAFSELAPREVASYEVHERGIKIHDTVWGSHEIGQGPEEAVFQGLLHLPIVRRSMGIEQLTLDAETATIPGTAQFSRWEHMWGSVGLVRNLLQDQPVTTKESVTYQLRTFVSDLGHTAYSHLGDWMFQGIGAGENQHDQELFHLLEVSGVNEVLRQHDFAPEAIIFPDVEDFVERPSPALCVDRVDYLAREIKRWLDLDQSVHEAVQPEAFSLHEGQIVMADKRRATAFAKASLLLATEHWSEPVHRLQLRLQEAIVKDVLQDEQCSLTSLTLYQASDFHPRDLLYTVDSDIDLEMLQWGTLASYLKPIMKDIGLYKRRIYTYQRHEELATFLRTDTADYPHPLEHYDYHAQRYGKLPLQPAHVTILPVSTASEIKDFGRNPHTSDTFLQALKPRSVDPLFFDEQGTVQRLSQIDANFAALLRSQAVIMQQAYVARIHVNTETKQLIEDQAGENQRKWQAALQRPRMSDEIFRDLLHNSAAHSVMSRMVRLHWTS